MRSLMPDYAVQKNVDELSLEKEKIETKFEIVIIKLF